MNEDKGKIKVLKGGPYVVTGSIPLSEKIIVPVDAEYEYQPGREFLQQEEYALCRCGRSKNMPYCDGSHEAAGFVGNETASKMAYADRAELREGPGLDLLDDNRCAFARFCHRKEGKAWDLVDRSDDPVLREEAIKAATDCPSGRLVVLDKEGNEIEPFLAPEIEVLQDPEKEASGPLFVKGKIPIESSDGQFYETRNRVALCRCGKSCRKPFCDGTHAAIPFTEEK